MTVGPDRLTAVRWVGLIIGFSGVAVLAGPDAAHGDALSVAAVLLTALGYAIGPIIANRKLADVSPWRPTPSAWAWRRWSTAARRLTWPAATPSVEVLGSWRPSAPLQAAAFVVYFRLIAEVGAARATVITYVNPAVAVALGVIVLGEHLTPLIVGLFALILTGSVLATRASGARPEPDGPGPRVMRSRPAAVPRRPRAGRPGGTGHAGVTGTVSPRSAGPAGRWRTGSRARCRHPSLGPPSRHRCCRW